MNMPSRGLLFGLAFAGFGLGLSEAAQCLHILIVPGTFWANIVGLFYRYAWISALLIALGLTSAVRSILRLIMTNDSLSNVMVTFAISGLASCALYSFLYLSGILAHATTISLCLSVSLTSIAISFLYHLLTPALYQPIKRSIYAGITFAFFLSSVLICNRFFPSLISNNQIAGFGLFGTLSLSPELQTLPSYLPTVIFGILYGSSIGASLSLLLPNCKTSKCTLFCALIGLFSFIILLLYHCVAVTAIIKSGYSELSALLWPIAISTAAGLLIAIFIESLLIRPSLSVRPLLSIAIVIGLGSWYVLDSRQGSDLYISALQKHSYLTRVYLHFHPDGSWTRSIERHGDAVKVKLCSDLLTRHPRNIFASDALFLLARCQFSSWHFADSSVSLQHLLSTYRDSQGAGSFLRTQSSLVQNKYGAVTSDFGMNNPIYANWRSREGAQLIGHAYNVIGQNERARGLYTSYISNLTEIHPNAWTKPALWYSEQLTNQLQSSEGFLNKRSSVRGNISSPNGPLSGILIALVQPHIDLTSLDDSRQFTGAKTIPLWFGSAAVTKPDGTFKIDGVPYGRYEVVIGFDTFKISSKLVLVNPVKPVKVQSTITTVPSINFVRNVEMLSPIDNSLTNDQPVLTWKRYPGAAYYSVSLLSSLNRDSNMPDRAYTCWAKSHITESSTSISKEFFVNSAKDECKQHRLLPDRHYMWMVFAYDKQGKLISSSEHYRLDREPVFFVNPQRNKGR